MSESNPEANASRTRRLLESSGLFDALDPMILQSVEDELETVRLPGRETLFREGDVGDSLYLLVHGRLIVSVSVNNREHVIGEIARGELVGEMAVLSGEPRSATVRAARDSDLLRFSTRAFERVVEKDPRVMTLVARRLIERLRRVNTGSFRTTISTIAVVPVNPSISTEAFTTQFVSALSEYGRVVCLTDVPDLSGRDLNQVLQDQEQAADFVVYQASPDRPDWMHLCVRQADRILLVARGDQTARASVDPKILELCRAKTRVDAELVLVHPDSTTQPLNTAEWIEALGVQRHHHLRATATDDYKRLVRILTGRGIGLVLGGGAARGFAHIGVLRSLMENRVPVDFIGGASMGSIIAAQFAAGLDWQQMIDLNRKGWIDMDPLRDKTLPLIALLSCRKLDRMIEMMFADLRIEDLWLKYFCVSANLTRAVTMVHHSGPLKKWVRASVAIPGVATPVIDNGDLLIDGGVLNNVPGDVMQKICGGSVIVVDANPQVDLTIDAGITKIPSPWKIIASRLNPLRKSIKVPTIVDIMMRTAMLASTQSSQASARAIDLHLSPPTDEFGMFEWTALNKLADVGYAFAQTIVPAWWADHPSPGVRRT
jgi:NTE family protein